jgi:diguanylate cyclase (GGDEF)-like protein
LEKKTTKTANTIETAMDRQNGTLPPKDAEPTSYLEALTAAFDNVHQGFLLLDSQWRVTNANSRLNELLGFPPEAELLGASAFDLVCAGAALGHYHGRSIDEAYGAWRERLEAGKSGEHLGDRSDGRTVKIAYAPFGKGNWIVTYEDVSAQVNAEKELAEQNKRFDAALTNIPHGVCMFDADRRMILCNAGYARLYQLPPELTVAGTPLQRILDYRALAGSAPVEITRYFDVVEEARAAGSTKSTRVELQDGRTIRVAHNPMSGGGYVATHEDITAAIHAEAQIRHLGSHDRLTGLPNGSLLRERIGEALARMRRGEMLSVHFLDLDNFKNVNDMHGHAIGDLLLKQVSDRLRLCLNDSDALGRLGGDEFIVLQSDIERPEQAAALARRLVDAMIAPFTPGGRQVYLGVSIGISMGPGDGADVNTLLKNADMAMYRSKAEGRNTFRFFEVAMNTRLQERRLLERDLRRAIVEGEFELYYQPQVDAQTRAITGCEALLRWHHPSRGLVPPNKFIPVAEEIGVIVPLGAWVIQQACRDAATWPTHIGVAVNLSSLQFKELTLIETVVSALDAAKLSPLRLELEITESALLADSETTIATLNHLRDLGVRIAMDDFGTGYSSLSYLRSFPFDKIKIDRGFIEHLGEGGVCSAIVRAVAGLGVELGMTITAEGVETLDQFRLVRDHGCTEIQGYFFGRPCSAKSLDDLFRANMLAA